MSCRLEYPIGFFIEGGHEIAKFKWNSNSSALLYIKKKIAFKLFLQ